MPIQAMEQREPLLQIELRAWMLLLAERIRNGKITIVDVEKRLSDKALRPAPWR